MMKRRTYTTRIGDGSQRVTVEPIEGSRYAVTVDGAPHEVDAQHIAGGTWSLIIDGESHDLELDLRGGTDLDARYHILVQDEMVHLDVQDERLARMGVLSTRFSAHGPQTLRAPMPGRIAKLLALPGATVSDGDSLVIIEAMKMENEVKAPTAGKVREVMVREGQTVEGGAPLLTME